MVLDLAALHSLLNKQVKRMKAARKSQMKMRTVTRKSTQRGVYGNCVQDTKYVKPEVVAFWEAARVLHIEALDPPGAEDKGLTGIYAQ